ncbi:hypothetical protein CUR178_07949 [Leishmania enriettii]|uniref:Palmitoyltransferase DHHC domain-containing protein n=1 Tax=Leishmania enriettii TaxID=5663 RepID=A0A836GR21_LEIEN|nr:hypothetical protein CUR178_07949 [Leishmania enriettii]
MQVFHEAIEKNGGPLPLLYYLQPDAGSTPDSGAAQFREKPIDVLNTRVDRRTFFECVLSDADFAVLTVFLMSGVPINAARDEDGASALHIAAAGTLEMLNDEDFQGGGPSGQTAGGSGGGGSDMRGLHAATGKEKEVADDGDESSGSTSRVLSPPCSNQLIISFLIDNGADVNAAMRSGLGKTPLMVAAARQNMRVVKLLLAKGADLTMQDAQGRTVLSYAVAYPHVMETLRSWMGEAVFYEAAVRERLLCTACRSLGNAYAALYLIEQIGLDVNKRDDAGTAAAMATPVAAVPGPLLPADTRGPGWDGILNRSRTSSTTPIFFAAGALDSAHDVRGPVQSSATSVPPTTSVTTSAVARSLAHIPRGGVSGGDAAAVEAVNMRALHSGDTPLHCAVSAVDVALVRALLSKGADVHAVNDSGATPLQLAQSQSSFVQSWKQYWKDELIMMLRTTSASAAAARRRSRERQRDRNPRKVRALLLAYSRANTAQARDRVLRDESALGMWQFCTPMGVVQFVATAALPHAFYFVCCRLTQNVLLLSLVPLACVAYAWMRRRGSRRAPCRPPCAAGWCVGLIVAQGVCLRLGIHYYKYLSVTTEDYYLLSGWLLSSVTATVLLAAHVVLFSSPGFVTSTEGQRKGIYASLRNAKAEYPKELLYGVDLRTMVRKPLRAQYCPQMRRVVLRYDHFCSYLSTAIGGGNHRAFLWLHVALLSMLCCFYYYAREHSRLLSVTAGVAGIPTNGEIALEASTALDRAAAEKLAAAVFMTAGRRFAYMYSQLILPFMILVTAYLVLIQLLAIARNLTFYDLEHSEDESSLYCFTLGNVLYSLFDQGKCTNLREFFGWCSLTQQVFRVPKINPYLQQLVKEHQRWQLTDDGACCSNHGHQQSCAHASGVGDASGAAATGAASTVTMTGETVAPVGWCGDKSAQTPRILSAQQREALAAVAVPVAIEQPRQGREAVQPEQSLASQVEEGGKEYDAAQDYGDDGSALAMQIFQEMVSSGSTDVGRGSALTAAATPHGGGSCSDAGRQREWDAAVKRAKEMYCFYLQSVSGVSDGG